MSHLWSVLKTKADETAPKAFSISQRTYLALKDWTHPNRSEYVVNEDLKSVLQPGVDARTDPGLLGDRDEPTSALLSHTVQSGLSLAFACERRPRSYVFARYGVFSFGEQVTTGPRPPPQRRYVTSDAVSSGIYYFVFRQTFAPKAMSAVTIVS